MKTFILFLSLLMVAACNREEGPAEKAGRQLDQAGKDASRAIQKAAENVRDAVKDKK